jgi:hypothetical protein
MYLRIFSVVLLLFCYGCQNKGEPKKAQVVNHWKAPAPGTRIDRLEQRITEDRLNKVFFRVTLISTEYSTDGIYKVMLEYGFNRHETQITLPDWPNHTVLRPELKSGAEPYQCYLGFDSGDGIFHELYEISVEDKNIRMRQSYNYVLQDKNNKS